MDLRPWYVVQDKDPTVAAGDDGWSIAALRVNGGGTLVVRYPVVPFIVSAMVIGALIAWLVRW